MSNPVNAKNISVMANIASAQAIAANVGRSFLQIQNRSNVKVTFKLDSDFVPGSNAVQTITFSRLPNAGAWKLTFDGDQTASLAYNIDAATLQAALVALPSIGAGNVTVLGTVANGFAVTFAAALSELPQPLMTVTANTLTDSTVQQSAVQFLQFSLPPEAGTFRLAFGADETGDLAHDISAADLKTALNALPSINGGIAAVAQDVVSNDFTLNFGAPLADQVVALLAVTHNLLTNSDGNQDDIQVLYAVPAAGQGSYQLMLGAGNTTAALAYNASADDIEEALEALANVGEGNVHVTGAALTTGFTVHFQAAKANTPFPDLAPLNVTLHIDTNTVEPQKRVENDVLMEIKRTQLGQGTQDVVTGVSTIEAGVAPATMAITVTDTNVGNAEPSEGIDLNPLGQNGDTILYSSSVPAGSIWVKAEADNSPVDILEG